MIGEGFGHECQARCSFSFAYLRPVVFVVHIYNILYIHVSIQLTITSITVTIRYFLVVFGRQLAGKQNLLLPWLICLIFVKIVWKAKLTDLDIGMI